MNRLVCIQNKAISLVGFLFCLFHILNALLSNFFMFLRKGLNAKFLNRETTKKFRPRSPCFYAIKFSWMLSWKPNCIRCFCFLRRHHLRLILEELGYSLLLCFCFLLFYNIVPSWNIIVVEFSCPILFMFRWEKEVDILLWSLEYQVPK